VEKGSIIMLLSYPRGDIECKLYMLRLVLINILIIREVVRIVRILMWILLAI